MKSSDQLDLRQRLAKLPVGHSSTFFYSSTDPKDVMKAAKSYGRIKSKPVRCTVTAGGVVIERTAEWDNNSMYACLDALAVGEHHDFAAPPEKRTGIRLAATHRNRAGVVRLTCTIRPDDVMRVTRVPLTTIEKAEHVVQHGEVRTTKYGLERLAMLREIQLTVAPADHHKVRLAATHKAKVMSWSLRCRLQDDGTMLVYRTDAEASHG
jgi:hypothetical protein